MWSAARQGGNADDAYSPASLLQLHTELMQFVSFMSPTAAEQDAADHALAGVQRLIVATFPRARVEVFGSRANGLVLPSSDWDICVMLNNGSGGGGRSGRQDTVNHLYTLARELERRQMCMGRVEVIASARVPILKFRERATGLEVDVSFDASSGPLTRTLVLDLLRRYPAARPLAIFMKYFLAERKLNETYTGGVGSFLLTLMAVHAVQAKMRELHANEEALAAGSDAAVGGAAGSGGRDASSPAPQAGKKRRREQTSSPGDSAAEAGGEWSRAGLGSGSSGGGSGGTMAQCDPAREQRCVPGLNLGVLLMSFLELFGCNLNYHNVGVSVRGPFGGYFRKDQRRWGDMTRPFLLSMENPVDPSLDVGRNSWAINNVRRAFSHAHTTLARRLRQHNGNGEATAACDPACATAASPKARGVFSLLSCIVPLEPLLLRHRELAFLQQVGYARARTEARARWLEEQERQKAQRAEEQKSSALARISGGMRLRGGAVDDVSDQAAEATEAAPTEAALPSPEQVEAITAAALTRIHKEHGSLQLRRPRLIADLLTRRERKVEEIANQIHSWY